MPTTLHPDGNGTAWMKWAMGAMGASIGLLVVLWVNGLSSGINETRRALDKLEGEFGIVRNEQLLRTGRLEGLKSDVVSLQARVTKLESEPTASLKKKSDAGAVPIFAWAMR